ncbi:YlxR family protein [Thermosynechococcus sp. PKX82]|uniref:YlxR family protein n=1 Tax=Thermosynechococcus sp. PKX82 TaxID=3074086 RepID=UPI002873E2DC|nr:YlxR family protein [Thermosynechococcus sp. PKX82]WNC28852.1 YlxR family protein [Thermosynechococcus sp. PKX82]
MMAVPQRRCVSCGRLADRSEFWRIVRCWPDQKLQLDRGMGRSAYLCPTAECLKVAKQKKRLARSLRCPIPEDIFTTLAARLDAHRNYD